MQNLALWMKKLPNFGRNLNENWKFGHKICDFGTLEGRKM